MPRAYGKYELQRIVDWAWREGQEGFMEAPPSIEDALANVEISHPENIPWRAEAARSWHPQKEKA